MTDMLQRRPISISAAVLCFFVIGTIGALGGLSPETCCKRAVLGAAVGYLTAGTAVWAINTILIQAMIASRINKEDIGDSEGQEHL